MTARQMSPMQHANKQCVRQGQKHTSDVFTVICVFSWPLLSGPEIGCLQKMAENHGYPQGWDLMDPQPQNEKDSTISKSLICENIRTTGLPHISI